MEVQRRSSGDDGAGEVVGLGERPRQVPRGPWWVASVRSQIFVNAVASYVLSFEVRSGTWRTLRCLDGRSQGCDHGGYQLDAEH